MLTEEIVKYTVPKKKKYVLTDEKGLFLEVHPSGKMQWGYRKMINSVRKMFYFGAYPQISLEEARTLAHMETMRLTGKFPNVTSPAASIIDISLSGRAGWKQKSMLYKTVHAEWLEKKIEKTMAQSYVKTIHIRGNLHILPALGDIEIDQIKPRDILTIARNLETQGKVNTAHRVVQICGAVFRYAIASGYADTDPTYSLRGALEQSKSRHMAALHKNNDLAALMAEMRKYRRIFVRNAMLLHAYTFVRPSELRFAQWEEIDLEGKMEWRIPSERMKMNRLHIVPLSFQAIELFVALKEITGNGKYVFRTSNHVEIDAPFSEAAVLVGLRSCLKAMGMEKNMMCAHGFRSIASTILNESSLWNADAIERQLAHCEGNSVRAAYNYAEYLPERRQMMQWFANYWDSLIVIDKQNQQ